MRIQSFYDENTFTFTYIVFDENSRDALILDPVLDFDPLAISISYESAHRLLNFIKANELNIHYILETHAHADHLSSSQYLKEKFPNAKLAVGENIKIVQETFKPIFNFENLKTDGSQFDYLLKDNEVVSAGSIEFKIIFTPGHTPACTSILIEDNLFTGDSIFMPDYGTGRCDFPAGSASDLYHSIKNKIYTLPDDTKIFVGHDYAPGGREVLFQTTVGESKKNNIQLKETTTQDEFIKFRQDRDITLSPPKLLYQSVQVNIDAGKLPAKERNGMSYLKSPIKEN